MLYSDYVERSTAVCWSNFDKSSTQDMRPFVVNVVRLPEEVYLATSEDVPGLVIEAETLDEARQDALSLIPDLLEFNGNPSGIKSNLVLFITAEAEPTWPQHFQNESL